MRLPFFSSSHSHDTPSKDGKMKKKKTKTSKTNGKAVEVATISCSPATVLSMESAGWPSSSSAASTPSSSSSLPSTSAAQEHGSIVSSNAPPAALPSPSTSSCPTSTGVTKEDIAVVLRRLDVTIHSITPVSDLDAAGAVTQEELTVLLAEMPGEDELLDTFRVFDSNGDGKITAEELRGALEMIGDDGCSVDDCRRMIMEIDSVGDGCVCFTDFARMMLKAVDVQ